MILEMIVSLYCTLYYIIVLMQNRDIECVSILQFLIPKNTYLHLFTTSSMLIKRWAFSTYLFFKIHFIYTIYLRYNIVLPHQHGKISILIIDTQNHKQ